MLKLQPDLARRILAVEISLGVAVAVGIVICAQPASNSHDRVMETTWQICGMAGVCFAGAVAGWVGYRIPWLTPFAFAFLTTFFSFIAFKIAERLGFSLDVFTGIDVAGLAFFSAMASVILIPIFMMLKSLQTHTE